MNKQTIFFNVVILIAIAITFVAVITTGGNKNVVFGGTTSDNFNIGGNLAVTGTSALTGVTTITGATILSSTLGVIGVSTFTGEIDASRMRQGGSVLTLYASTSLTAAQVCDNSVIITYASSSDGNAVSNSAVMTLTFPATTTLYADCLTTNGDSITLSIYNSTSTYAGESSASTTLSEGTGSPSSGIEVLKSADTAGDIIILPQEMSRLILTRISIATTTVEVHNFTNGD